MSSFYPIIGLAGKQASGKTTASDFLAKTYNGASIALADPIKRFLFQLGASEDGLWGSSELRNCPADLVINKWGLDAEANYLCEYLGLESFNAYQLIRITEELAGAKIRDCLKAIGAWGREIDPYLWIRYGLRTANRLLTEPIKYEPVHGTSVTTSYNDYVIISDLRYRNEILKVKETGGYIIKLVSCVDNKDNHKSETELDGVPSHFFNKTIRNDGSLVDLQYTVVEVMREAFDDCR